MTDRELLGLAAKACGELTPSWYGNSDYMDGVLSRWNPLTDDGDALRLAVKLGLNVEMEGCLTVFPYAYAYGKKRTVIGDSDDNDDPYAATRRAIVRAAAEIGKEL